MSFDVNQGCSGMVYGLNIACALLSSANTDNALLLLGDTGGKNTAGMLLTERLLAKIMSQRFSEMQVQQFYYKRKI